MVTPDAQQGYESFYGLVERPFSLTPDPRYYFRSQAHARAFEAVVFAIRRRESMMLVTGDLGTGKTLLCRALLEHLDRRTHTAFLPNPLVSPENLLRVLLQDLGAVSPDEVRRGRLGGVSRQEMQGLLSEYLLRLRATTDAAVLVIDEAHLLPGSLARLVLDLSAIEADREKLLQVLLVGQPVPSVMPPATWQDVYDRVSTRAEIVPFDRDECAAYIAHRLHMAGAIPDAPALAPRALDRLFDLTGGVARLVNLVADRALQEAAAAGSDRVDPQHVEAAATALEMLRPRAKRFRWFNRQVSSTRRSRTL